MKPENHQSSPAGPPLVLGATGKAGLRGLLDFRRGGRDHRSLEDGCLSDRLTLVFLFLSGLLLLGIGSAILVIPQTFHGGNGIALDDDPSLLSEVRAPGGLLTASSILILVGTFRRSLRPLATVLTVLFYGSFGLARLLGFALDGIPTRGLVGSTVIELIVALIGLLILFRSDAMARSSLALPTAPAVR